MEQCPSLRSVFLKEDGVGGGGGRRVERKGGTGGEECLVLKSPYRQPTGIFLKIAGLKMEK